jgi:hypothetical protein
VRSDATTTSLAHALTPPPIALKRAPVASQKSVVVFRSYPALLPAALLCSTEVSTRVPWNDVLMMSDDSSLTAPVLLVPVKPATGVAEPDRPEIRLGSDRTKPGLDPARREY